MTIDLEVFNIVGNKLTDVTETGVYKRINPYIFSAYNGLPGTMSKLACIIFGLLLKTKLYGEAVSNKDIDEDKRIYTDIAITIEDILNEWDHVKYSKGQSMAANISNMNKRIRELSDNNVFYCWRYKSAYMFIMERDFRTWKYFNSNGCCIPKTLRKIAVVGNDMISCMVKIVSKLGGDVDKSAIEKSFGYFINDVIGKMNSLVATEVVKWDGKQDVQEYLVRLTEGVKNMEEYKGLTFAHDIFDNLPFALSKKLQEEMKKGVAMKKEQKEQTTEQDIIPSNSNLVKPQRVKNIRKIHCTSSNKVQTYTFDNDIDPLKDALHLMRFYRAFLQQCAGNKIMFDTYDVDSLYASQILDLLQEHNRFSKVFIMAWLKYFYEYKLKGNKFFKIKYTSMKIFMESFHEYNSRYVAVES